jgi:hypothetical protein
MRRPRLDWLQLAVPVPAFAILLTSLVPFTVLKPLVDSAPGGGMVLFGIALLGFVAAAAVGVWGTRQSTDVGARLGIVDLRLAFGTRLAIHAFFLGALIITGWAAAEPILLASAIVLVATELPLAALVRSRGLPVGWYGRGPLRPALRGRHAGDERGLG